MLNLYWVPQVTYKYILVYKLTRIHTYILTFHIGYPKEPSKSKVPQLNLEFRFYKQLDSGNGALLFIIIIIKQHYNPFTLTKSFQIIFPFHNTPQTTLHLPYKPPKHTPQTIPHINTNTPNNPSYHSPANHPPFTSKPPSIHQQTIPHTTKS